MTSVDGIKEWFERGVRDGKKYMLVLCDTFSWDDYPEYFDTVESARQRKNAPGEMQKYMESYDLAAPMRDQLIKQRSHAV
jgi:hypothetical protein